MKKFILGLLLGFIFRIFCQQAYSFHYEYVLSETCRGVGTTFNDQLRCTREKVNPVLDGLANHPPDIFQCFVPWDNFTFSTTCKYTRKLMGKLTGRTKPWWEKWDNVR